MEGYARHSRSHFGAAPPPPASAGAGTAYCKKAYSNGAAAGGNGFMAYDDVFGGPPKFGATPFAPRAEDYSEIFGSFRSSRSSSIPMLDLPPVDDSVAAFEVLDCSGLEYSDIFGGFDFADFAASYDELFRGSDGSEQSSDEAWTPAGTESPSGESDLYNSSGKNQYFLNGDFHETFEDKLFDVSYHNVNPGTAEDSELIHEAQLPGHTYIIEGSNIIKEDEERYSSGVADDVILCEDDSSGNVLVEAPWKKSSVWSHSCVVKQSREYSEKAGGAHGSLTPSCVSFCDVSLKTEPSHLPPASRLPPTIVDRKKYPSTSTSDYEQSNSNTAETIFGGGSFDCFDVEPNAGSSSITPAAAIKEAMDRAKIKINSAKEVMKRKEEGVKDMPFMNNDLNNDGKVRMVVDESISGDNELLSTHEREPTAVKILGDNVQVVSEASHVLPGSLPEDAVSTTAKTAQRKIAKKKNSTLDPVLTEEDGEWKVTTDCFELVNNGNSKTDPSLPGNINKPVQEINMYNFDNANGKTMHFQKLGQIVEGIDASVTEHEDSESVDGACNPTENRRRLRANKAASRNTFHEKMVKLAQDVHETVISGHVETVKRGKEEGLEGDGTNQNPEKHLVGERNERRFDQADQGVRYDRQHKEESYLARIEIRSEEEPVQANCDKKGKDDCRLKENEMRSTEVAAREETVKRDEFTEKKDNWRRLNDAHQNEEREEACTRRHTEEMKKVLPHRDENLSVLYEALEQKDGKGKSGKDEKQDSDVRLEKVDEETSEREHEICEKEAHETERCEEFAATSDFYGTKEKECGDSKNFGKHDVATENISAVAIAAADNEPTKRMRLERSDGTCNNEDEVHNYEEEMEELIQTSELEKPQKVDECSATNEEEKMERKVDLQADLKITDLHNNQEQSLQIESEHFISVGPFTLDEAAAEMAYEHEELKSSHLPSSPDDEDIKSSDSACESEEKLRNHAADDMPIDEEKAEFKSGTLYSEMESKLADMEDICMSTRYPQKLEADHPMMSERKESAQKQYQSTNMNQRVGKEAKAVDGVLAAEDREMAKNLKRKEESDRERTSELQLEKEREKERELEKERLRKLEEERDKERENELEMLRVRRLEELREREREREKELAKEHLRKLEEERQREREKDFEKERLRKLEEEWEREREREKDRMGVELKMSAARERVSVEVRERAERAAVERATAEARQRAMAEARERLEKACAEAREKSVGKASKDAQLRAERAAVERATAEARERAIEKAIAERATFETRERVERSVSEKFSASFRDVGLRHCSSSNDLWNSDKSDGVQGESAQRCKARLERHRRTVERVAKALAEKNMRDLIAQREQAERNRLAETLDADIKRWSNGKEGNLRALLSTLQYILGPDSGWHPVPLTDVITSAAVKKAYRKATLCVHPDKLQQRGATIQQKYICEKVFDLLKDAWNRFNSEER